MVGQLKLLEAASSCMVMGYFNGVQTAGLPQHEDQRCLCPVTGYHVVLLVAMVLPCMVELTCAWVTR
jgi:hypothetical protein